MLEGLYFVKYINKIVFRICILKTTEFFFNKKYLKQIFKF